jgi:hypothetical protein
MVAEARTGGDVDKKRSLVALIDQLTSMTEEVPTKMADTRELLLKQIKKAEPSAGADGLSPAAQP